MPAKLVTIGDSLTQGFQSGAIRKTDLSWPRMVAKAIGATGFRTPDFTPHPGGPLLDVEHLVRSLGAQFGDKLDFWELPQAAALTHGFLSELEAYWERGAGTRPVETGPIHHNLAVWGFELGDVDTLSDGVCRRHMPKAKNHMLYNDQVPEFSMYRTARRTLNPSGAIALEELTQLDLARKIAQDEGGIETLTVFLGANNVLGTCASLRLEWSQSADLHKLAHQRSATVWEPQHFERLLDRVYPKLKKLQSDGLVKNIIVATVPHVTAAPCARGVTNTENGKRPEQDADGYFEYYTRFFVWDAEFCKDPDAYTRITREDARRVRATVDEYNAAIQKRAKGYEWPVVDLATVLDKLAFRHNRGKPTYVFPQALINALAANEATKFRVFPNGPNGEQRVLLDTRYMNVRSDVQVNDPRDFAVMQKKHCGGLFSLDGVHPTTIGYGVLAHELLTVMKDANIPGADPAKLNWQWIVDNDTLVTDPPRLLENLQGLLGFLCSRGILPQLMQSIAGYGAEPLTDG